ncbi:MAG: helix-hairpin-helix domain-containing protein [Deltaproteobacteria bacterium]|nr:helix-hairpin-helix domain-containing protein [Deltaproteobacteria bacterium]
MIWRVGDTGAPPPPCPAPALVDGALVCDGRGVPAGARAWLAGERLDVNQATVRELEAIPGVGPVLARAIVEARSARGGFASFDELDLVPGIGDKTLVKLARYLRVAPAG